MAHQVTEQINPDERNRTMQQWKMPSSVQNKEMEQHKRRKNTTYRNF